MDDTKVTIELNGRVDSNNAAAVEQNIFSQLAGKDQQPVVLDTSKLEYISSAGLRILLRLKKTNPDITITGVNSEIYEILEMTGFTEMMKVEKAYRVVDITGCEEIGRGANGTVYRIDQDNVVKVFNNPNALEDIQHEREVARLALILGVPTAISYDVVKVGDSYGSVYELLNARSFTKIMIDEPEKLDWCVEEFVKMLKKIHGTEVPEGKLPDARDTLRKWADYSYNYLPKDKADKVMAMVSSIPYDAHMIHGDYHTKNLELQNDEVLLIDMDTLAVGNPIIELGSIYNAFVGFAELDPEDIKEFQGFDYETSKTFWKKFLAGYLGTNCDIKHREVEDKARIIGYIRLIRRMMRRDGMETEKGRAEIAHWKEELIELLDKTDTLLFEFNELELEAVVENLDEVQGFVEERLESEDCSMKARMQIGLAVEEVFVNIAQYAYGSSSGKAIVRVEVTKDPIAVKITFIDHGKPYDPLTHEDPDVTLSAEERDVGGLGIFLTKKSMDDVNYEYKNGQNILTLKKNL